MRMSLKFLIGGCIVCWTAVLFAARDSDQPLTSVGQELASQVYGGSEDCPEQQFEKKATGCGFNGCPAVFFFGSGGTTTKCDPGVLDCHVGGDPTKATCGACNCTVDCEDP